MSGAIMSKRVLSVMVVGLLAVACGPKEEPTEAAPAPAEGATAAEPAPAMPEPPAKKGAPEPEPKKAAKPEAPAPTADTITLADMENMLPMAVEGMVASKRWARMVGLGRTEVPTAEVPFTGPKGAKLVVKIEDIRGLGDLMRGHRLPWLKKHREINGPSVFERVEKIEGHPTLVRWDIERGIVKVITFVERGFIITAQGIGVEVVNVKAVVAGFPLKRLAGPTTTP